MKIKICNICKNEKSIEEFSIKKDGCLSWACKKCVSQYYKKRHSDRIKIDPNYKEKRRIRSLSFSYKTKYGIDIKVKYQKIFDQNNKCEICNNVLEDFSKSYLDHNHETKKVRGVLCPTCNTKLAGIEDKQFLIKATKYLEKYES